VDSILSAIGMAILINVFGVGALVMASVRIVAGFWPTMRRALLCATLVFILSILFIWTAPLALGVHLPTWPVMLVLNTVVMNSLIRQPDGTSMGLFKAGLAALAQFAVEAAVILVLALVLGLSIFEAMQNAQ
jgi:hypothetical protein